MSLAVQEPVEVATRNQPGSELRTSLSGYAEPRLEKSALLDLAYEEYCLLRNGGVNFDRDAFCARFPSCRASLRKIIDAHQLLESVPVAIPAKVWPEAGDNFSGYRLVRSLGKGAFARVFLAWHPATARHVALKIAANDGAEARLAGPLVHPNIVPIYDARELSNGFSFVSMPYLGLATLTDLLDAWPAKGLAAPAGQVLRTALARTAGPGDLQLRAQPFDPVFRSSTLADALTVIAGEVASGLAFLHAHDIRHRDLKPSNILLSWDYRPVILDFNLSEHGGVDLPHSGGTLPYMAPEQVQSGLGTPLIGAFNARADIFSFGVILYELLSGVHPFGEAPVRPSMSKGPRKARAAAAWLVGRHFNGARSLLDAAPGIDPALARLVHRCLAFDPSARPTAADIVASITQLRRRRHRAERWMVRHRFSLAATVLLALTGTSHLAVAAVVRPPAQVRHYLLAKAAVNRGDHAAAQRHANSMLQADPDSLPALAVRGRASMGLGNFDAAVHDLERVDEISRSGENSAALAYCQAQTNHYDSACRHAQRAIDGGYKTATVYNLLGASRLKCGPNGPVQFEESEKALKEAIRRDGKLQAARFNYALLQLGKWEQSEDATGLDAAAESLEKALELGTGWQFLFVVGAQIHGSHPDRTVSAEHDRKAIRYLAMAIEHGFCCEDLLNDDRFVHLKASPEFSQVLQACPGVGKKPGLDPAFPNPVVGLRD